MRPAAIRFGAGLLLAFVARSASAQPQRDLNSWLNQRIDSLVAGRLLQNDRGKTPLMPAGTPSRASIIDRANLPDVAGISIALPSARGAEGGAVAPATSLATSPYMVLALLNGDNPLDPTTYLKSPVTRRLGISTTWDTDPQTGNTVPIIQAKYLIRDRRNPLEVQNTISVKRVLDALNGAGQVYGPLQHRLAQILWVRVGLPAGVDSNTYMNGLVQPANFEAALRSAGASGRQEMDDEIEKVIESFYAARATLDRLMEESRKEPQFSVGYTQRGVRDSVTRRAALIYDIGRPSFDITLNGIYNYATSAGIGRRSSVEGAAQLLFRLTPDDPLAPRTPMSLAIAGTGSRAFEAGGESVFKVQALMLLPVGDGVTVPLSATWASSAQLVNESRVAGNVGFSFDVAQIFSARR